MPLLLFREPASSFLGLVLFSSLPLLLLLFSDSSHFCLPSVHVVGGLTSELPSRRSLLARSLDEIYVQALENNCWQDLCTRSLGKISATDLCAMSLYKVFIRVVLARSPYKISKRGLSARLLKRYPQELAIRDLWQDLCTRSLQKLSVQDLRARSLSRYVSSKRAPHHNYNRAMKQAQSVERGERGISQEPFGASLRGRNAHGHFRRFMWC